MNELAGNNRNEVNKTPIDEYPELLKLLKDHFKVITNKDKVRLFTTDAGGLYDKFLDNLPEEARQEYECSACRSFVDRFGGLVIIKENGEIEPAIWGEVPPFFAASVNAIMEDVVSSRVTGVFISNFSVLGQPLTGDWHHMSIELPSMFISDSKLKTSHQLIAEKLEDYKILIGAIDKYPIEAVNQAITLLKTDSLYRSEKCLGVAIWFKDLHNKISGIRDFRKKNNIIWRFVALAPTSYCHINSSMIGTLLDDIVNGLSFESVSKRFADKMNPMQYQRPQAKPSIGNILQAEKIVEKLGIKKSLHRRFARLEELNLIWKPVETQEAKDNKGGIFSHLITYHKKSKGMEMPAINITWEKFNKTVLPSAKDIQYLVKVGNKNYSGIVTAEYDDAPPIIQWDTKAQRNPFSQYVYVSGSSFEKWNLSEGYCKVTGICYLPSMWYGNYSHHGKAVHFILEGAKDVQYRNGGEGNVLFPEDLMSELYEIRATIEAYSKKEGISGYDKSSACGIKLQGGSEWSEVFKVISDTGTAIYKIDRWD